MMLWLLAAEWLGLMGAALIVSPRTWTGGESRVHPHVWAAVLAGPAFILPAIAIALLNRGTRLTRHVVAAAQMLVSILLIDVTGGRIETHFHIFGSLAFLAFYRDWPVVITASAITAIDHAVRGVWWPQSVYGVLTVSPWRWVEHAWWVAFEDFFLIIAARRSLGEMWMVAAAQARLHEGAHHDVLTGLPNRRLMQERFDSATAADVRRAVLFIDLDKFKLANDTLGHTIGDKLLKLVACRLGAIVTGDDILARIGGDEFLVLLDGISGEQEARRMALRLLDAMGTPFEIEGHHLLLSASVGISLSPEHGTDLATLQERADQAMYAAKSWGRNQCATYSLEMTRREETIAEITRDLYKAQSRNELEVYFQPVIGKNGALIGFESLLRWFHPVLGSVPPSDFIPVAESSGLIVPIGEWVLAEACARCKSWQLPGGDPIKVGVNVSGVQFEQADFPDRVARVLRRTGLDPVLLTLELTESVLVRDVTRALAHISALRAQGIRIALDDFGTGYSSLSYLTSLPADIIKLDRSLLHRESSHTSPIIEAVVDLAHRLGMRVIGEGVETRAQADRLFHANCDAVQGFYFSPPVPAAAAAGILSAARAEDPALEFSPA